VRRGVLVALLMLTATDGRTLLPTAAAAAAAAALC